MDEGSGRDATAQQAIFFEPAHRDSGIMLTPEHDFVASLSIFANKAVPGPTWTVWVQRAFAANYAVLLPLSYLLMVVGTVEFAGTADPARIISLVIFGVHSINVLTLSALVDAKFRYQTQGVPLAIIGAGIGLYRLATICRPCHAFANNISLTSTNRLLIRKLI
jgi:hypothetical protein